MKLLLVDAAPHLLLLLPLLLLLLLLQLRCGQRVKLERGVQHLGRKKSRGTRGFSGTTSVRTQDTLGLYMQRSKHRRLLNTGVESLCVHM